LTELHEILRINQEEMWEKLNSSDVQEIKAQFPLYYCVNGAGTITMWPRLTDDVNLRLYWAISGENDAAGVNYRQSRVRWAALRQAFRRLWR